MMPECVVEGCMSFAMYYVARAHEDPVAFCENHEEIYRSATEAGLTHEEAVSEVERNG